MKEDEVLLFCSKKGIICIEKDEIVYCKAAGRYAFLKTRRKMTKISENLKSILGKLDKKRFVRIHHSMLVNLSFIKEFSSKSNMVIMKNGKIFSISVRKKKLFLKAVDTYYK